MILPYQVKYFVYGMNISALYVCQHAVLTCLLLRRFDYSRGRARSTRNWGRAREGSREGERREAKRLREKVSISWHFCRFLVMLLSPSFKALVSLPFLPCALTTFAAREKSGNEATVLTVWDLGPVSRSSRYLPGPLSCFVFHSRREFQNFWKLTVKFSAIETKWTSLEVRTHPIFLETSISKYDAGSVNLPGLSRNGPLEVFSI